MAEERPDLFEQLWDFLGQILMPAWADLIAFIPLIFLVLIVLFFVGMALMWRRAGARNRDRLPRRPATGSPPAGVHLPGPSRWPFVAPIGLTLIFFGLILGLSVPLLVAGLAISVVASVGWLRDAMREWRSTEIGHDDVALALAHGTPARGTSAHGTPARIGYGASAVALPAGGSVAVEPRAWEIEPPPNVHMPGPSPWPFFAPIALTLILFGLILSVWLIVGGLILAVIAAGGWLREASREWHSTERLGHAVPTTRDPQQAWPRRLVPVFATVIALSIILALLPLGFAWLGSLAPGAASPTPLEVPSRPEISASTSTSFDRRQLVVPAGRDFELVFDNREAGVPHNVDIADSAARATTYFEGEIFNGVDMRVYQVPALEEGDYYFLCRVHPNMNGTVLARPESPGGPNGPGTGPSPAP